MKAIQLPLPSSSGPGPAVDISSLVRQKTLLYSAVQQGTDQIVLELSADGVHWSKDGFTVIGPTSPPLRCEFDATFARVNRSSGNGGDYTCFLVAEENVSIAVAQAQQAVAQATAAAVAQAQQAVAQATAAAVAQVQAKAGATT